MSRLLFIILTALCCLLPLADEAYGSTNALGQVNRALTKEPRYESTPKYSLLVLGNSVDVTEFEVPVVAKPKVSDPAR